jgi:excisionase family DNA binding protein
VFFVDSSYAEDVGEVSTDLVTTGQAAAILGSSRQHVVDLCTSGRLPFQVVGTHRRIRRSDVVRLMGGVEALTRDQQRSLWLHRVVAGKVALDPARTLSLARRNLSRLRSQHPAGAVTADFDEWEALLAGPVDVLLATLVSTSRRAVELRQNSPFAGVLTERERTKALAAFRSATRVA